MAGPGTDANANDAIDAPPSTNSYGWEQGTAGQQPPVGHRQTSNFKTTSGPQKKLTPPLQLHERKLLRVSSVSVRRPVYWSSSDQQQQQHHPHPDGRLLRRSRSLSVLHHHRHHHHQDPPLNQDSPSAERHIRVYLQPETRDRPSSAQENGREQGQAQAQAPPRPSSPPIRLRLLQQLQLQLPQRLQLPQQPQPRGPPPRPPPPPRLYPVPGRRNGVGIAVPPLGSASRSRATIANFNRKYRQTQAHLSVVSKTAAQHRSYWPDNFRDPRHGLSIGHSSSPDTSTRPISPVPPVPAIPKSLASDRPKPRLAEIGPLEE
ncbi:uncharacterized protein LY79DRAFT_591746 [Colletotrichum navitas]|uniref:Uncharacterized protein n=1 Tax=Colletotrichum navitas TaxID=681940 RepID=A0AAD8PUS4_9PEZI|nr:uncharacterized protein LY79DRAFT_591746 [Colletotrichum navitas]KAK1585050.1 hypothetical protein LY79DRAFT_591746 [Colletotrichum navitas]